MPRWRAFRGAVGANCIAYNATRNSRVRRECVRVKMYSNARLLTNINIGVHQFLLCQRFFRNFFCRFLIVLVSSSSRGSVSPIFSSLPAYEAGAERELRLHLIFAPPPYAKLNVALNIDARAPPLPLPPRPIPPRNDQLPVGLLSGLPR